MKLLYPKWSVFLLFSTVLLIGCSQEPVEIFYGSDQCAHCKMIISDERFAAQIVTPKGKALKFDAIECMTAYANEHDHDLNGVRFWVSDFSQPDQWLASENASYIRSKVIKSPMGMSLLALPDREKASVHLQQYPGKKLSWNEVMNL